MQDNFHRPADHEAKMARADLFKCAQYSFKLFKMIGEDQELEGWVQAKITKAADYIASVYHYMEYEMKISEYGSAIENSDMYSESIRRAFAQKLTEAKKQAVKAKDEMKKKEKDLDEAFDDKAKVGDKKKTATGELEKTSTGVKHTNTSYKDDGDSEEKSGKGGKSHAKSQSAAEKKSQAPKLKQSPKSAKTWGMKDNEKFDNRDKEVKEGSIQGGVWTADAPKKGAPNVPVPSPNEGPTSGSLKPGQPGYAAQMLKNKQAPKVSADPSKRGVTPGSSKRTAGADTMEGKKPDFLDMDKDGDKKEPMKKAVADKGGDKPAGKKGMSAAQEKFFGKKKTVKESIESNLSFKEMMALVVESGGQQQIDPVDNQLWAWAQRVAKTKIGEGMKADVYAGMVYERMGGAFEMYDVLSEQRR